MKDKIKHGEVMVGNSGPPIKDYREHYVAVTVKAKKTTYDENNYLKHWETFLGPETKIGQISTRNILAFRAKELGRGISPRTVNLHFKALRQLLKLGKQEGYISKMATDGIQQVKETKVERPLMSTEDLNLLRNEAMKTNRGGKRIADLLGVLMYSGGRIGETLKLQWKDVDWTQKQLVFVGDNTKNSKTRRVDFNDSLKNHLLAMKETATSEHLFPSNRIGGTHVSNSYKFITTLREKLKLPQFSFHLCRHYFISMCVMAGIDYLTIATWVGHRDGGVLIGRTYGHLSAKHMKEQAEKLTF